MAQKIIDDYSKWILKPLNNDNLQNSCWINSALYLISSHPFIFFQYLILDNTRLIDPQNAGLSKKKQYDDIYINNIIYNYKYIKSETNKKSKILYTLDLHKNLYDKIKLHKHVNVIEWGEQWDAIPTLDFLLQLVTKTHPILNNNVYLTVEQHFLRSKKDIDKYLNIKDGITNNDKLLLGFVRGDECNNYDIHHYGNVDTSSYHWVSFIRNTLNPNNDEWYYFGRLNKTEGTIVKKDYIYSCFNNNDIQNIMCIYIDMKKFKEILSNPNIRYLYDRFLNIIKPSDTISTNIEHEILNLMSTSYSNPNVNNKKNINLINLLTIKELEIKFNKHIITNEYYTEKDKRAYFNRLNLKLG